MTQHTKGPIRVEHGANLIAADGYSLTGMTGTNSVKWQTRAVANAEHVVRCWNSHDDLLAALEECVEMGGSKATDDEWRAATRKARAAIDKAKREDKT